MKIAASAVATAFVLLLYYLWFALRSTMGSFLFQRSER